MSSSQIKRLANQTYSNRVSRSEFDNNWKMTLSSTGYVIYTALADNAKVEVLLTDGTRRLVVFRKNGKVFVGSGGTSHFSKPHLVITILEKPLF